MPRKAEPEKISRTAVSCRGVRPSSARISTKKRLALIRHRGPLGVRAMIQSRQPEKGDGREPRNPGRHVVPSGRETSKARATYLEEPARRRANSTKFRGGWRAIPALWCMSLQRRRGETQGDDGRGGFC
jgi:hypothetical protein